MTRYPTLHRLLPASSSVHLSENVNARLPELSLAELKAFMEKNCQPYLQSKKGPGALTRCSKTAPPAEWYITKARENRKPRDSSMAAHEGFIQIVKDAGGKANRDNSLFTSGDMTVNSKYGSNCGVVVPIGPYAITWSTKIDDLYAGAGQCLLESALLRAISYAAPMPTPSDGAVTMVDRLMSMSDGPKLIESFKGVDGELSQYEKERLEARKVPLSPSVVAMVVWARNTLPKLFEDVGLWAEDLAPKASDILACGYLAAKQDAMFASLVGNLYDELVDSYKFDNIDAAIASGHEVMILADSFLVVSSMAALDQEVWDYLHKSST